LTILRKFSTGFGSIRQIGRNENFLVAINHLLIAGKWSIWVPELVWFAGMTFQFPPSAMGIMRAPVKEKRFVAADEVTTFLRHPDIISSELSIRMSFLEWENALWRIMLFTDTSGTVSCLVEQSGKSYTLSKQAKW
jgi:hypothetical protein